MDLGGETTYNAPEVRAKGAGQGGADLMILTKLTRKWQPVQGGRGGGERWATVGVKPFRLLGLKGNQHAPDCHAASPARHLRSWPQHSPG